MSSSIYRKRNQVVNKTLYYDNKVNTEFTPHNGIIPALQWPVPTGSVMAYIMPTAPVGWLICDGAEILRESYKHLFSVIGTTFGAGDGNLTFKLPDYRGAFLRGASTGTNGYSGPDLNQYQTDSLGQHNHTAVSTVTDPGHNHTQFTVNDDFNCSGSYPNYDTPSFPNYDSTGSKTWSNINSRTTGVTVSTSIGNTGTDETRPYNYGIHWIIKC